MPLGVPIPPSPEASAALLDRVRRARHRLAPGPAGALGSTRTARSRCSATATELPFDLFLGVPVHRAPDVVVESGHDRRRLDPGRPADAARPASPTCTPSATSPASARPRPACSPRARPRSWPTQLIARVRGDGQRRRRTTAAASATSSSAHDQVAKVDVTFLSGQAPVGDPRGPVHRARPRQGDVRGRAGPALVRAGLDAVVSAAAGRAGGPGPRRRSARRCRRPATPCRCCSPSRR